jgi:hypothetical protein
MCEQFKTGACFSGSIALDGCMCENDCLFCDCSRFGRQNLLFVFYVWFWAIDWFLFIFVNEQILNWFCRMCFDIV